MSTWPLPQRSEPPHAPAGERAALEARLDFQRATLLMKCAGLTPEQLAMRSVEPSTLSLLGLIRHMSVVESWFHFYDDKPIHQFFWDYNPDHPDGSDDVDTNHAEDDLASYLASVERSREAVAQCDLGDIMPDDDYNLRYVFLHMIEEYARHNGHADLLRERIDGTTGE
ncbi:mini-circle uncharacterized 19.1 kDa protein [Longispora fulva]|uniref:DinB family protein n=1 Tax=Longispora fulva TaxID=619741 RepID=A0A8J7KIK2_9ACTN|nr:DinB family protein [Longispora fulva]MBG6136189.1 hypothetical protein [Longispora fulva]GIG63321.1 mini-circle uncharacterized 19.1 kDa protein [Longispora fulva]